MVVSWDETAFLSETRERTPAAESQRPLLSVQLPQAGQRSGLELAPFYQLFDERYTVYWKVNRKNA